MSSNSDSGSERSNSNSEIDINPEELDEDVFDNDVEPLATEEEASAYSMEFAREEQEQQELLRRFNREISIDSWLVSW